MSPEAKLTASTPSEATNGSHRPRETARGTASIVTAFVWGLAEATLFFVVPDVYLTRIALRDRTGAVWLCVWATGGAMIGGTLVWTLAAHGHAAALLHMFTGIPGISGKMIAQTGEAVAHHGAAALFGGALRGQPFKLFALHAGIQGIALPIFLVIGACARLTRFLVTTVIASLAGRLMRSLNAATLNAIHALVWIAFYVLYFWTMRPVASAP